MGPPLGVPGGLTDPSPMVNPWTPGEPISYAAPGLPGVGPVNGGVTMGGLGKGFGFQIGGGTQGISHILSRVGDRPTAKILQAQFHFFDFCLVF